MKILAIETSSEVCGAALIFDNKIISEKNILLPKKSSSKIFEIVKKVLKDEKIDCVAVDIGPGSFTGIRIGVSFARTYGQFLKIPVIGVSSLDCLVYKFNSMHLNEYKKIYPVIDALRDEVYTARYSGLKKETEYQIMKIEELKKRSRKNCVITGNKEICEKLNLKKACIETRLTSSAVGMLAGAKTIKVIKDNYKNVFPLYIRRAFAEEKFGYRK